MLLDSHVHVGYYSRKGCGGPFYYSPKRIMGVLNRCGVDEFIVSSTCAQVAEIGIKELIREAKEMKRLAGHRAHIFFWLSGHLYDEDPTMGWFSTGLFAGIKLHEMETPWMQKRRDNLERILSFAEEHGFPIMFHAGPIDGCRPLQLTKLANKFPSIHFNFAHCRPMDEMARVIADCPNVWTDTAYMELNEFSELCNYGWHGRLMFGTDLPVWQACGACSLTKRYSEYVQSYRASGLESVMSAAFREFVMGDRP